MKLSGKRSVFIDDVIAITCDICQRRYDDPIQIQTFFEIDKTVGYGSVFGDGVRIKCDLCQYCLKEKLGAYLQLEEQPIRV